MLYSCTHMTTVGVKGLIINHVFLDQVISENSLKVLNKLVEANQCTEPCVVTIGL